MNEHAMTNDEVERWKEIAGDRKSVAFTLNVALRSHANMQHEIDKRERLLWSEAAQRCGFNLEEKWQVHLKDSTYKKSTQDE